jgi:hypothetical protein
MKNVACNYDLILAAKYKYLFLNSRMETLLRYILLIASKLTVGCSSGKGKKAYQCPNVSQIKNMASCISDLPASFSG